MLYTWNQHNILYQLYFNKKKLLPVKKKGHNIDGESCSPFPKDKSRPSGWLLSKDHCMGELKYLNMNLWNGESLLLTVFKPNPKEQLTGSVKGTSALVVSIERLPLKCKSLQF